MTLADLFPGVAPAKLAVRAALAVVLGAFLAWAGWKLFFADAQIKTKTETVKSKAISLVNGAERDAAGAAANTVANGAQRETIIRERTFTNYRDIVRQPGAGDEISPEVDRAFRRAVCMRSSAAGLPECRRLPEADPN